MVAIMRHLPDEHSEQASFLAWCHVCGLPNARRMVHVPNEGQRSAAGHARQLASGLAKGYPDLLLDHAVPPYHGLRLEMKRRAVSLRDHAGKIVASQRAGALSKEQAAWLSYLRTAGYAAAVAYGFWEAKTLTEAYYRGGSAFAETVAQLAAQRV